MQFKIDPAIFEKFSGLHIGLVIAKDIDNSQKVDDIQTRLRQQERRIRDSFMLETLSEQPKIKVWRDAYAAFGAKPKDYRSSIENLYRLVLEGGDLRSINTLVDIYNCISLKHMVPAGGEDLDKVEGDIILTFATNHEPPALLLGDKEPRTSHAGEVLYKDNVSSICRRWNWREADRTKLTEQTKQCVLVIEGLPPITKQEIEVASEELRGLVLQWCGGQVRSVILDQDSPVHDL